MQSIEKEAIYDVYCISHHQYQRFLNIHFLGCLSGAVGSVGVWCSAWRSCHVVGSSLARGEIFTASIGSVDSLYPSVFIYFMNLHQFLILCISKAMMFVKLYFRTSYIYLISLVIIIPWIYQAFICELNRCHPLKKNQYTTCTASVIVNISAS